MRYRGEVSLVRHNSSEVAHIPLARLLLRELRYTGRHRDEVRQRDEVSLVRHNRD